MSDPALGIPSAEHGDPQDVHVPVAARLLLEDFGRDIGLPGLAFSAKGECWLNFGDNLAVFVFLPADEGAILVCIDAGALPPGSDAQALKREIDAARPPVEPGKTFLVVDGKSERLKLAVNLPLPGLDQTTFQNALRDILHRMERVKRDPLAECAAPHGRTEHTATTADLPFDSMIIRL
ncbi:MAG: CesT family type III secretion system chaperone [Pseudochelatococcus sp.]|jgi:hypothetical protein|uniref:CesT family type III secretion system chaperone n=1 Tax=Pseudochelatococcus sp. TaxID=2020869 RepID=UPI003D8ECF83